jgi:hypothetical protein
LGDKAKPLVLIRELAALLFELYGFRNSSGNFAMFAAIRRASSLLSNLAARSIN